MTDIAVEQETFPHRLFVVAGFPRTGTTSIFYNLDNHPSFVTPRLKELNFFSGKDPLRRTDLETFFGDVSGRIRVDASPFYSLDLDVPGRIRAFAPGSKVLLLLREPDAWIVSIYRQIAKYTPFGMMSFEAFLEKPVVAGDEISIDISSTQGIYRNSVERFARTFGDDLLVANFDAFARDPLTFLKRIEQFCGAEAWFDEASANVERNNASVDAGFLSRLMSHFTQWPLVRAIMRHMPKPLIRRMQQAFYGSAAGSSRPAEALHVPEGLFAVDKAYYRQLFESDAVITGRHVLELS